MKQNTLPASTNTVRKNAARISALCLALSATQAHADLTKADNTTQLQLAGSYVENTVPATADTIIFNNTLVNNTTFTTLAFSAKALQVVNPTSAIQVNISSSSTVSLINSGGVVIDMSSATQNLTLTGLSAAGNIRVRGSGTAANSVATLSVASGRTLGIQTNLLFNNASVSNSTNTIRMAGAGNLIVNGTNGKITDKTPGSGLLTAFVHDGTGTVTFSNASTYTGGTTINSGTLVAGNATALGGGSVTVSGGTLDLNGASALNLSLASGKNLTMSAGTMSFNLGTSADQITSAGSAGFTLSGGTIALTLGSGFDYNTDYQLFSGFSSGLSSVSGISITGYDTVNYTVSLNTSGLLDFVPTAVPEPSTYASLCGGLVLAGCVARRRGRVLKRASEV